MTSNDGQFTFDDLTMRPLRTQPKMVLRPHSARPLGTHRENEAAA